MNDALLSCYSLVFGLALVHTVHLSDLCISGEKKHLNSRYFNIIDGRRIIKGHTLNFNSCDIFRQADLRAVHQVKMANQLETP